MALSGLDERREALLRAVEPATVRGGWVRYMRKMLGMTLEVLGRRVGMTRASVQQIEIREMEGRITLSSLRKLAGAMDCDVVYAFVPRKGHEETLTEISREKAARLLRDADVHMTLEDQAVTGDYEKRVAHLADELLKKGDIW